MPYINQIYQVSSKGPFCTTYMYIYNYTKCFVCTKIVKYQARYGTFNYYSHCVLLQVQLSQSDSLHGFG